MRSSPAGLAAMNVPAVIRPAGAPALAPCIRQTCLPFTAGARQVTPLRLFFAVPRR